VYNPAADADAVDAERHGRDPSMRTLWAGLMLGWLAIAPAAAQSATATTVATLPETEQSAIRNAILGQMEAFKRDDAGAAYAFASRMIQAEFRSPELFLEMVRRAYAPVHRPREARFRQPEPTSDGIRQPVIVQGPDGRTWLALYNMQRQADGSYRIDGCTLVGLAEAGA
jgi:hypothetical protein